jgi:hypothetical protein
MVAGRIRTPASMLSKMSVFVAPYACEPVAAAVRAALEDDDPLRLHAVQHRLVDV